MCFLKNLFLELLNLHDDDDMNYREKALTLLNFWVTGFNNPSGSNTLEIELSIFFFDLIFWFILISNLKVSGSHTYNPSLSTLPVDSAIISALCCSTYIHVVSSDNASNTLTYIWYVHGAYIEIDWACYNTFSRCQQSIVQVIFWTWWALLSSLFKNQGLYTPSHWVILKYFVRCRSVKDDTNFLRGIWILRYEMRHDLYFKLISGRWHLFYYWLQISFEPTHFYSC